MTTVYFRGARGTPELPLRAAARERYGFPEERLAAGGALQVPALRDAQTLAKAMSDARDARRYPESAVRAGELYAAALVQEMLRLIVAHYLSAHPDAIARAYTKLETDLGPDLSATLARYVAVFQPKLVARGEVTPDVYLTGEQEGLSNKQVAVESLILLHFANVNPALGRLRDLFDDSELQETRYPDLVTGLEAFFAGEPDAGEGQKLFDLLRAPINASPTSLEGQLGGLRGQLGALGLGGLEGLTMSGLDELEGELLRAGDTLREEQKPNFGGGPGPAEVFDPAASVRAGGAFVPDEYEAFSQDSSWMPRVVMLAKSTFVWLGQLSKQYGYEIGRLDEIPDEELDELAKRGFTGLWLIGLWERSKASKTIKNLRGNPDAVASAYSLYDYVIADDLGGAAAYETLKQRAWQRGIRLASDMVPNHVGVDGKWVVEHPEWFLQLDHPPYPSYSFNGPDLSQDGRVGIFLEDHYYDSSDAAVVFKREDRNTGQTRYIYHGNDGTSMPWNDTAQIDYLNPEAREAVIQTILHVARLSSIIRFDAAMTLAKRHVQRLWYPEPGSGGAIASRAQYGTLSTDAFNAAIPEEFWREVVDRVAREVPDTLLLAEAFWMMEGYFVRTLGMHRVYNSAFMHMFKNEDNAKYRLTIKNVLEFEPEILKRFVNFMNNPDEETAVAQFGKDDKYFGVCVVLATMPGLPMFGHGQVEGYTEKYGMEYRRAKLDEDPDGWLIDRHHREVFPLLHRRYQFAEVENFALYDVHTPGGVDEDVYAYSNLVDGQASLVVFNNKFGHAEGWIHEASPQVGKEGRTLSQGLGLQMGQDDFVTFREQVSGLNFIRRSRDLQGGLALNLDAYKYQVFLDFHEVTDADGSYARLHDALGGRGSYDLSSELTYLQLEPVHAAFREVVSAEVIRTLRGERGTAQAERLEADLPTRLGTLAKTVGGEADTASFGKKLAKLVALPTLTFVPESLERGAIETELEAKLTDAGSGTLYAALVMDTLAEAGTDVQSLRLEGPLHEAFMGAGLPDADRAVLLVTLLRRYGPEYSGGADALLTRFGTDDDAVRFAKVTDDTFDAAAYHELSVRPLAYVLMQGAEPETLVPVMTGLSEAETAASGSWSALTKTSDDDVETDVKKDAEPVEPPAVAKRVTEDPGEAVVTAAANPALSAEKAEANAAGKEPAGVVAAEASRTTPTPVGTAPGATSRGPQKGPQKGPKKGPQKAKSGRKKR